MEHSSFRSFLKLCAFSSALLLPTVALAEEEPGRVEECFGAYEQTQIFLRSNDLENAKLAADSCSSRCPEEIVVECKSWADQASRELPSILLLPRTENGRDATDIEMKLDGLSVEEPPGSPVPLNPGPHTITFLRDDGWEESIDIVAHKGEKRRQIRVEVPPRKTHVTVAPPPRNNTTRNWTIASFGLSGLGFIAAATGGVVGLNYKAKLQDCDQICTEDRIKSLEDRGNTWLMVGDIGLIVGAVGAVTGTALLIWGPKGDATQPSARLDVLPTPGGASGLFTAKF